MYMTKKNRRYPTLGLPDITKSKKYTSQNLDIHINQFRKNIVAGNVYDNKEQKIPDFTK